MVYPKSWKCPNCKHLIKNNKQCQICGFKYSLHYPSLWNCPECNNLVSESRTCKKCGYPNNLHYPYLWHCPKCKNLVHSSTKCDKCGYTAHAVVEKKSKQKIQSKINKIGDILSARKKIILVSLGIISIIGIVLLLSIPTVPVNSFIGGEVLSGESFSPFFTTSSSAQNVLFDFVSPNGDTYSYEAVENNGEWTVPDLTLNESGTWSVIIKVNSFGAVSEIIDSIYAIPACETNDDCGSGVCCFGSCNVPVCESDDDCDDNIDATRDSCVLAGTCNASCNFAEPLCFPTVSDNYCPSACDMMSDIDCTNCPDGHIMCNNECYDTCSSNNDCNDEDENTFDECVININPCESYCQNTIYDELSCPSGQIRDGSQCITPTCSRDNDCDDGRSNYAHRCVNAGTNNSYCYHWQCDSGRTVCVVGGRNICINPVCNSNNDCDDGSANSFAYCMNHGTCDAYCISSCDTGYSEYGGECLFECESIADCALNQGRSVIADGRNCLLDDVCLDDCPEGADVSDSCFDDCDINENWWVNCYSNLGFTYRCDYNNEICRSYECLGDADCDDGNLCTNDVCDDEFFCSYSYVNDNTVVNDIVCCSGSETWNCDNNDICNEVDYSWQFNEYGNIGLHGIATQDTSIINGILNVNADTNCGVYFGFDCVDGGSVFITADIKVESGSLHMAYEAADADSDYATITAQAKVWQTYTINATMDCSKTYQAIQMYANEDGTSFNVDNLNVYVGQGNPMSCNNPDSCTSECVEVNECVNNDNLCSVDCVFNNDNDCEICTSPAIYCEIDEMGVCLTPQCYSDDDCTAGVCSNAGTCDAMCI